MCNPIIPQLFPKKRITAGFTTREGGISEGPYQSLNLGGVTSDNPGAVTENRRRLCTWAGANESQIAVMGQVHGGHIAIATKAGLYPETDGLLTAKPGLLMGVLVADCVPLLLFDSVAHVAGTIHCGWRSLVAGIAEEAVRMMSEIWGTQPSSVLASIGPAAGVCCYEIGRDVADQLSPASVISRDNRLFGDLRGELTTRLVHAGVAPCHIENTEQCTICSDRFFSHRRDSGVTGRMMGFTLLHDN